MRKQSLCLIIYLSTLLSCSSMNVSKINKNVDSSGLYYALPKTILLIEATVTVATYRIPEKYKGIQDVQVKESIKILYMNLSKIVNCDLINVDENPQFSINDISISTKTVPDIENIYKIELKKLANKNLFTKISLKENGLIQGVEKKEEDKTFSWLTKGLESIASIVGKILKGNVGSDLIELKKTADTTTKSLTDDRYKEVINEFYYYYDLAQEIIGISEARAHLMQYDSINSSEALKIQLDELNKKEKNLLSTMTKEKKSSVKYYYEIDLGNNGSELVARMPNEVKESHGVNIIGSNDDFVTGSFKLFRFNSSTGVGDLPTYCKYKVGSFHMQNISLNINNSDTEEIKIVIEYSKKQMSKILEMNKKLENNNNQNGYFYRVPAFVTVKLQKNDEILAVHNLTIAQLGEVLSLPVFFNDVNVEFFEDSGAIKTASGSYVSLKDEEVSNINKALLEMIRVNSTSTNYEKIIKMLEQTSNIKGLWEKLSPPKEDNE